MSSPSPRDVRADDRVDHVMTLFPRDPRTAARARDWLGSFLAGAVDPGHASDAALVLSELATNALQHGLGDVVIRASIDAEGAVQMSVTDSGDELPALLPADPTRIGGLGLRVVDQLAARWGVAAFPGGKTVWATVVKPG